MKNLILRINATDKISHINPELYGHFSEHLGRCIYNGIFVGENSSIPNINGARKDIIEAFKKIKMPVLRWPGGCFADEYHWKDGIGEKSTRKKMVNTNWGGVTEDNSFGTNEFFNLCEEIGCEPYLAGNLGSGTVQELSEWVEYITFDGESPMADLRRKNGREKPWKLKYLGIGNENWGCGGNMRPEYYADEYRRYQSFCKDFSGNKLFKIACGPSGDDYNWTDKLLSSVTKNMTKGISLHYYTIPHGNWDKKGDAVDFTEDDYYSTIQNALYIEEVIRRHCGIMDRYDKDCEIGLIVDEWGCWYDVEKGTNPGFLFQQNTMRDAIVAAGSLNIFNTYSERVIMANLAQAVNVLQALVLTEGEKMVLTPTYHVFDLYTGHHNGELVYSSCEDVRTGPDGVLPLISESASVKDDVMTITIANCSLDEEASVNIDVNGFFFREGKARILSSPSVHDHNDFDNPEKVVIKDHEIKIDGKYVNVTLPPFSVVALTLK